MDWGVVPWGLKHMCEYIQKEYQPQGRPRIYLSTWNPQMAVFQRVLSGVLCQFGAGHFRKAAFRGVAVGVQCPTSTLSWQDLYRCCYSIAQFEILGGLLK